MWSGRSQFVSDYTQYIVFQLIAFLVIRSVGHVQTLSVPARRFGAVNEESLVSCQSNLRIVPALICTTPFTRPYISKFVFWQKLSGNFETTSLKRSFIFFLRKTKNVNEVLQNEQISLEVRIRNY